MKCVKRTFVIAEISRRVREERILQGLSGGWASQDQTLLVPGVLPLEDSQEQEVHSWCPANEAQNSTVLTSVIPKGLGLEGSLSEWPKPLTCRSCCYKWSLNGPQQATKE